MIQYIITSKRWFDKINGNTYHTVSITDTKTNTTIEKSPITYGYGEQCKHTAYDILIKKGLAQETDRHNHELNRQRFHHTIIDVNRKKDL